MSDIRTVSGSAVEAAKLLDQRMIEDEGISLTPETMRNWPFVIQQAIDIETTKLADRLRQSEAIQDGFTKWADHVLSERDKGYSPTGSNFHELINLKADSVLQQGLRK